MAERLVEVGVPAVIAMQYEIEEKHAITFAREFYNFLLSDRDNKGRVATAMGWARRRLAAEFHGHRVVGTPVLYLRAGDDTLFDIPSGTFLGLPVRPGQREAAVGASRTLEQSVSYLTEQVRENPADEKLRADLEERTKEHQKIKRRIRLRDATVGGAVLVALVLFSLIWLGVFNIIPASLKPESYAIWLANALADPPVSDNIAVVVGRNLDKTWRDEHAIVLDRLSAARARVVAFDMWFSQTTENDSIFAAAITRAQAKGTVVVVGVNNLRDGQPVIAPALREAKVRWGVLCVATTRNKVRTAEHATLLLEKPDGERLRHLPGFGLAAVAAFRGDSVVDFENRDLQVRVLSTAGIETINASGMDVVESDQPNCSAVAAGDTVATLITGYASTERLQSEERRYTYDEFLGPAGASVASALAGKIVLIGAQTEDERFTVLRGPTPETLYGVDIHADVVNSILTEVALKPFGQGWQFALIFLMALVGGGIRGWRMPRWLPARGWLLAVAVALYLSGAVYAYARHQRLLLVMYHLAALLAAYFLVWWIQRRWFV
jgi:CHASE2 domain-containing sensor protein